MNTTKLKLTLVGICGLMLLPVSSHAAQATVLNSTTALFTIDFEFTDNLFDVHVPIAAEFGVTYEDRVDTVGYSITSEDGEAEKVSATGIVLSRQNIEKNRYAVDTGETGMFTLMILATFDEPINKDYRVEITKLPYWFGDRRTTVHQNQLSDLQKIILKVSGKE